MTHIEKEKSKLLNRLKRLRGQLEAIERAVDADMECARVLQLATSCRGALDGFIAEVIEDHIRERMIDSSASRTGSKSSTPRLTEPEPEAWAIQRRGKSLQ